MTNPMNERSSQEPFRAGGGQSQDGQKVLIVGPDGMPVGQGFTDVTGGDDEGEMPRELPVTEMVEQPAKVMRIGSMIKQLLEEVRAAPLDEASRARLKDIHASSIKELELGLAPELVAELERLALPFSEDSIPTEAELRIAQAQLVGWLEGLFHGIQTALFAQQMAARAQLEQMRRALPPGLNGGEPDEDELGQGRGIRSGPYL
ncbi:bacterial proteasome activator family protein [Kitasatospora sp. NPDC051170]|uniref:bacterial proteasome activator family protein n=1 Tax=Kitasatospora sp. NPDC051170 TaxID=3364056 RepID=UPI00378D1D1A